MATPQENDRDLPLMTDADIARIVESRDTSGNVNMLHPLEVRLNRAYLTDVIRTQLTALQTRDKRNDTSEQLQVARASTQQCIDFLSWLSGQPEQVHIALYPANDDGLADLEDLTELLSDEDSDLPF